MALVPLRRFVTVGFAGPVAPSEESATTMSASARDMEVTRKQALLASAVLATGASSAHAEACKKRDEKRCVRT